MYEGFDETLPNLSTSGPLWVMQFLAFHPVPNEGGLAILEWVLLGDLGELPVDLVKRASVRLGCVMSQSLCDWLHQ